MCSGEKTILTRKSQSQIFEDFDIKFVKFVKLIIVYFKPILKL